MFKMIFLLASLIGASALAQENLHIQCGDVNSAYVQMDLSESFKNTFLTLQQQEQLKKSGFKYLVAGRNCGLNSWDNHETQFEVLLAFGGSNLKEVIDLGPFSIFRTDISLSGSDLNQLLEKSITGITLVGENKKSLSSQDNLKATIKSGRGASKVTAIIRRQPKQK